MRANSRPDWFWQGIAEAYESAVADGEREIPRVTEFLRAQGIESKPHDWIVQARKRGFLTPTRQGFAPSRNQRCIAVADALGIDPEKLRWAVLEFADGRLIFNRGKARK